MDEREPLMQAILDAPEDDAPRLACADWLERGGEAEHAELIRVQCSLAAPAKRGARPSRADLQKREKVLLALPVLNPLGKRSYWKYERGFVERFMVSDDGFDGGSSGPNVPFDKVLSLCLSFGQGANPEEDYMERFALRPWLTRVTHLQMFESCFRPAPLRALAASPLLTHLRAIEVRDGTVSAEALPDLVLAPAVLGLRSLAVCGEFIEGEDEEPIRSEHPLVDEAIARIAGSSRMAGLKTLVIDGPGLGEAGARAILESPHLGGLTELQIGWAELSRELRQSLRTRLGAAVKITGPDGYSVED